MPAIWLASMTELKLDFDCDRFPTDFMDRLRVLDRLHALGIVAIGYRRSRRGWHVRICIRRSLGFLRLVAFQAILGSDWKREAFNSRRARNWRDVSPFWRQRANVLYRRHYRGVAI
jgi:hypothetical protein